MIGGFNVHYSSGVYNRAFYILAHKANWDTHKAWEVFARANANYYSNISTHQRYNQDVFQATNRSRRLNGNLTGDGP